MNLINIHIGNLIKLVVQEKNIEIEKISKYFDCNDKEIDEIYKEKSLDTEILLKWSKLLEYDFFRIYTQHLISYSPRSAGQKIKIKSRSSQKKSLIPEFRKNIYTSELINFILELIDNGEKSKQQIIEEYRIPKTTLQNWITKYKKR